MYLKPGDDCRLLNYGNAIINDCGGIILIMQYLDKTVPPY